MAGVNKVMLIGNLTRDPEIRYGQNGTAVTSFTVACNETWTDKQTGEKKDKAEFIRVVSFRQQAETLEKYLSKGSQIYIEGKLQTRNYEKDGQNHYITEVVVSNFTFLGGGQKQQQPQGAQGVQPGPGSSQAPQYPQGGQQYQQQPPQQSGYRGGYQQAPAGNQAPPQQGGYQQAPQGPPAAPYDIEDIPF